MEQDKLLVLADTPKFNIIPEALKFNCWKRTYKKLTLKAKCSGFLSGLLFKH